VDGIPRAEAAGAPEGMRGAPGSPSGRDAMLDQALWARFRASETREAFASAWLALQCRRVEGSLAAVLVLGEPGTGPYRPAAAWPEPAAVGAGLSAAAEEALRTGQGVATEGGRCVAAPVLLAGKIAGVVALMLESASQGSAAMRHLHWGAGWLEAMLRREQMAADAARHARAIAVFDLLGAVLEHDAAKDAATALATELALRLGCDPVAIGFRGGNGHSRVVALSHAASFEGRMTLLRDAAAAMDEAIDQRALVLHPAEEGWDYRVARAHSELMAGQRACAVLTVPLRDRGEAFGALLLIRPGEDRFLPEQVELADAVATVAGPVLAAKRREDRWLPVKVAHSAGEQARRLLGPGHFGRKLATLGFAMVVGFFAFVRGDYAIGSPAVLEGRVQRSLVAPAAGFIREEHARAGDRVEQGQLLAQLDDADLRLERLRLVTQRAQRQTEYDRALAARQRAEASIARAQMEQAEAQLALVEEQLARTRIVAPFPGIVVRGNLSQRVGNAVERGEQLFQIAPLDEWRVVLEVHEADIADIRLGQRGTLLLASLPDVRHSYRIARVMPVAEQAQGRNFFRVEAELEETNDRLRPAMLGVGRTEIEERLLIRIWTRRLFDWARLLVWRWVP